MDFERNIFPGFNTLQLSDEVKSLLLKLGETPEISQEEFYLCRCSTTFILEQETMKNNACQMPISFLYMQKDLEKDNGHLLVLVLRKSGTLSVKIVHKGSGTKWRKERCWVWQKADVQFSVPQSSSSLVPRVIKTDVPLDSDDLAHKDLLLQKYGERIEKLSQQDKLSKFCMDAGFLNVVEIGQYFMT